MRTKLLTALLCGLAVAGQIRSQEVVVAREARRTPAEQATPTAENTNSESGTSTGARPQVHGKKSGSVPLTIEQMRMAGALAAERLKSQARVEQTRVIDSSNSQPARAPVPSAFAVAKPARKETRVGQTSPSRVLNSRNPKSEVIGPVRPTMIEFGRGAADASGPAKTEARGGQLTPPQSATQSVRKQETILSQLVNKRLRETDSDTGSIEWSANRERIYEISGKI